MESYAQPTHQVDLSNIQVIPVEPFQINAIFPRLNKRCEMSEYKVQVESGEVDRQVAEVRAVAALTPDQFELFSQCLMDQFDWVAPYGGTCSHADFGDREPGNGFTEEDWALFRRTAVTVVLKVMNVVTGEFFLTDSQGYDYARYVGFAA